MAIGGLDIGTSGCKITVYDNDGALLHKGYRDYPVRRGITEHEIDATAVWNAVKELLADAAAKVPGIEAIGITSFGESCVLLDDNDLPLLPSMLYTDPRGSEETELLIRALGAERIASITGINPHSMYSLPKIMWQKKHHPDKFARARRVVLFEDYIVYLLTGNAQIDYSLASRTMAFDIRKMTWDADILKAAGVGSEMLSKPVPPGTIAGTVKKDIADSLSMRREVKIISCCHDQIAATVGAGVLESAVAIDGAGTVECITPVFNSIPASDVLRKGGYPIVPFIHPGMYATYAFLFTSGALTRWFIDTLAGNDKHEAGAQGISVYEKLERGMKDCPSGILVLPHFAGAATPHMDLGSKGVIVGLTLSHTAPDIYRAVMEGIVYEMRMNMQILSEAGIRITTLRATGGGAASKMWLQMKADILNVPVMALKKDEAGTVGSVMLTGVAVGMFKDIASAAKRMIVEAETYHPRPEQHAAYMKYYDHYTKLYGAVRPLV